MIAAAMLLSAVAVGCAGGSRDARDAGGVPPDSASAATLPPTAALDPVPAAVAGIGHHAENAYDMAKAADWTRAQAAADSLRAVVAVLPDTGAAAAGEGRVLRTEVTTATGTLERAVTSRDAMAARRAANRLTELGAQLAAPYGPRVPASVTLLDFYGRELELWAGAPDGTRDERLRETASAVRRTWDELRPQVVARGGTSEAARFDSLVAGVAAARTRAEYARLATPVLDQVDLLERVFSR